jgi:hypothetical protein
MSTENSDYRVPEQIVYKDLILPGLLVAPQNVEDAVKLQTCAEDVIIAAYPRSGTHWTSEIVSLLVNQDVQNKPQCDRVKFLDTYNCDMHRDEDKLLLKTHLPFPYIKSKVVNNQTKLIVVLRNPKDIAVSYYHFYCSNVLLGPFKGSFSEFLRLFLRSKLVYGSWLRHVTGYLSAKHLPNVHFVVYEEMVKDARGCIAGIARFLGVPMSSDSLDSIYQQTCFREMKRREKKILGEPLYNIFVESDFFRCGKSGQWAKYLTSEECEEMEEYATPVKDMCRGFTPV